MKPHCILCYILFAPVPLIVLFFEIFSKTLHMNNVKLLCLKVHVLLFTLYKSGTIPSHSPWSQLDKFITNTRNFIFFYLFIPNPEHKLLFYNIPTLSLIQIFYLFILLSLWSYALFSLFFVFRSQTLFTFFDSFWLFSLTFIFLLVKEASKYVCFASQLFLSFCIFFFSLTVIKSLFSGTIIYSEPFHKMFLSSFK